MGLSEYLAEVRKNNSASTYSYYRTVLTQFDGWLTNAGKSIEEFTADDFTDYLSKRNELRKSSRRVLFTIIKNYARRRRQSIQYSGTRKEVDAAVRRAAELDAVAGMRLPNFLKGVRETQPALSLDDIKRLLGVAHGDDKAHIYLLAYFGFRVREYLNAFHKPPLETNGVVPKFDYVKNELVFAREKTYVVRALYFDDYVKELMEEFDTNRLQYTSFYLRLKTCGKKVGVSVYPHQFRRSFVTLMTQSVWGKVDDPDYVVRLLAGHSLRRDVHEGYKDPGLYQRQAKEAMTKYHYLKGVRI